MTFDLLSSRLIQCRDCHALCIYQVDSSRRFPFIAGTRRQTDDRRAGTVVGLLRVATTRRRCVERGRCRTFRRPASATDHRRLGHLATSPTEEVRPSSTCVAAATRTTRARRCRRRRPCRPSRVGRRPATPDRRPLTRYASRRPEAREGQLRSTFNTE